MLGHNLIFYHETLTGVELNALLLLLLLYIVCSEIKSAPLLVLPKILHVLFYNKLNKKADISEEVINNV